MRGWLRDVPFVYWLWVYLICCWVGCAGLVRSYYKARYSLLFEMAHTSLADNGTWYQNEYDNRVLAEVCLATWPTEVYLKTYVWHVNVITRHKIGGAAVEQWHNHISRNTRARPSRDHWATVRKVCAHSGISVEPGRTIICMFITSNPLHKSATKLFSVVPFRNTRWIITKKWRMCAVCTMSTSRSADFCVSCRVVHQSKTYNKSLTLSADRAAIPAGGIRLIINTITSNFVQNWRQIKVLDETTYPKNSVGARR